jgi:hypothetical protein
MKIFLKQWPKMLTSLPWADFTQSDSGLPAHTCRAEYVSPAAKEINDHGQEEEKTVDEHRWELDPASSHVYLSFK